MCDVTCAAIVVGPFLMGVAVMGLAFLAMAIVENFMGE
jgi:hypothetical protein